MSTTSNVLNRDLYILEDESNPHGSKSNQIYPTTIIDQVIDNESPVSRTLRDVLNDILQEIKTGGSEALIFPVTSVNNLQGDVVITPRMLGLENVNNTADMDKPMSNPQRQEMEKRFKSFTPEIDWSNLNKHISDTNNPHNVTIEQLNKGGYIDGIINSEVRTHNTSTKAHADIRNTMTLFNSELDKLKRSTDISTNMLSQNISKHLIDEAAHANIFSTKENIKNKALKISTPSNSAYPTTKAVVDYVLVKLEEFKDSLNDPDMWIDDILVISNRSKLPEADACYIHKAYFIKEGIGAQAELAICRQLEDDSYSWDISQYGPVSRFDNNQFIDTIDGMKINIDHIATDIANSKVGNEAITKIAGELVDDKLKSYYSKNDIDKMDLVSSIKIITGTMNGCIRYYINDDQTTMSDDIRVSGLNRMAFVNTVEDKHMAADYMTVFANIGDTKNRTVEAVSIDRFVETLKPLLSDLDIDLEVVSNDDIVTMVTDAYAEVTSEEAT